MIRRFNHLQKVFRAWPSSILSWLNAKGYSGEFSDALTNYFKSKSGLTTATLFDHINTTVNSFGYSGTLNDQLHQFFTVKTGIANPVDAENAFWANTSLDFSLLVPIALVASTQAGSVNFSNVTTSAINTTGAKIVIVSASGGGQSVITDSKSNTWVPLTKITDGGTGTSQLFYCINPTVGSGHTFTNTVIAPSISVMAFSNVTAFDVQNGVAGSTITTLAPGSITPSFSNCLVITGFELNGGSGAVWSVDSGFTANTYVPDVGGSCVGCGMAYKIQTTALAINPNWSGALSSFGTATIASFKNA